jgi:hypothetical protein
MTGIARKSGTKTSVAATRVSIMACPRWRFAPALTSPE